MRHEAACCPGASPQEGRCLRAEVRVWRFLGAPTCRLGACWWAGRSLEGVEGPGEGAEQRATWELMPFIHPEEMTFQMHIISSMQMRGLLHPV